MRMKQKEGGVKIDQGKGGNDRAEGQGGANSIGAVYRERRREGYATGARDGGC